MPMNDQDARDKADNLLRFLIQHQPQLLVSQSPTDTQGERTADFIAALRKGLTEMFKTQS